MGDTHNIEASAADWVARCDRGLEVAERDAFERWLDADVSHRVAWLRLEAAWRKVDHLAEVRPRSPLRRVTRGFASIAANPGGVAAQVRIAAAVVLSLSLLSGAGLFVLRDRGVEMQTAVGARSVAPLSDGSRIELNTDTALRVAVDGNRRVIWIDKGEAYFDIAHDREHPFVIHAGKRQVTVLGTRFTVRRDGDRLEVAVAEGRVKVEQPSIRTAAPKVITLGDRLVAEGPSVRVAHVGAQAIADEMGWRQGLVNFQDASLAEVAAELNRYNRTQIVITDPTTADVRIGGAFDPLNVDAFVGLLGDAYGLKATRREGVIYISGPGTGMS